MPLVAERFLVLRDRSGAEHLALAPGSAHHRDIIRAFLDGHGGQGGYEVAGSGSVAVLQDQAAIEVAVDSWHARALTEERVRGLLAGYLAERGAAGYRLDFQ